jgi:hypothetical protein
VEVALSSSRSQFVFTANSSFVPATGWSFGSPAKITSTAGVSL